MSRKLIAIIVGVALVSVVGVLLSQALWLSDAFQMREEQSHHKVLIGLKSTANSIVLLQNQKRNSIELDGPRPDLFLEDLISDQIMDSVIRAEMQALELKAEFKYAVYDTVTYEIILGSRDEELKEWIDSDYKASLSCIRNPNTYFLSLHVHNSKSDLVKTMYVLIIFSALFIIGIILSFLLLSRTIYQQKNLSTIKSDFVNNMTHEFKTPLATIAVASEMLRKTEILGDEKNVEKYARVIGEENNRILNQVEHILNVSSLEKGDIVLKKKEVDIHHIIEECVRTIQLKYKQKKGEVELNLHSKVKKLYVDDMHITNILLNLLDNAFKFSQRQPKITVFTSDIKGGIVIEIRDNGIGIKKENHNSVFKQFYRVPTGNVHNAKGFGLGLYYVSKLIEKHNGTIEINSIYNIGTTFKIFLPID